MDQVEQLISAVYDDNAEKHLARIIRLGELGDPRAVSTLALELMFPPRARQLEFLREAVRALGRIGGPEALKYLIEATRNREPRVRSLAVQALGELEDPKAIPALTQSLQDESWIVQRNAVQALGYVGDRSAVGPLITVLNDPRFTRDAAVALGHIAKRATALHPEFEEALRVLSRILEDSIPEPEETRRACRTAIRHIEALPKEGLPIPARPPKTRSDLPLPATEAEY